MVISSIYVEKFRAMEKLEVKVGKNLTAIAGRNATMKTTLLGMLGQPFSIAKGSPLFGEKTIEGYNFRSQFQEKFKISSHDRVGEHAWTLHFNNGNYYNGKTEISIKSAMRKTQGHNEGLRFINAEGKEKGMGYVQLPVIFLSLSRLFPVGESGKTKTLTTELSQEEKDLFITWYKRILSISALSNPSVGVEKKDTKRVFSGISDDNYGVFTNSAGEGNVGRILLSVLSLKRVKEKYPSDYSAGILLIDELDASLHAFSQDKIVEFLEEISKNYRIQVIFTTHSPIILSKIRQLQHKEIKELKEGADKEKYCYRNEIVYLKPDYADDGKRTIKGENSHSSKDFLKVLAGINLLPYKPKAGIRIYCEDQRAINFLTILFKSARINIADYAEFVGIDLSWGHYKTLIEHKVPEFLDSIVVLDHDVPEISGKNARFLIEAPNVVFLPITIEKDLFAFMKVHSNFNDYMRRVKEKIQCEFDYETCFNNWPEELYETNEYKKWMEQIETATGDLNILYEAWCEKNNMCVGTFTAEFIKAYNSIAERNNLDLI